MSRRISNIYLHGSVTNPETIADIMLATGRIAVPSNRTRGVLLVTEEDYLIRQALMSIDMDKATVFEAVISGDFVIIPEERK